MCLSSLQPLLLSVACPCLANNIHNKDTKYASFESVENFRYCSRLTNIALILTAEVKIEFTLKQATKAQSGTRGMALLFL